MSPHTSPWLHNQQMRGGPGYIKVVSAGSFGEIVAGTRDSHKLYWYSIEGGESIKKTAVPMSV